MDIDKIIQRAKAILLTPKTEWPVIAAEPTTVPDLYKNYIVVLAAIPAVFGFIKGSLIGYSALGYSVKVPVMMGITNMILTYALSLGLVYLMALIVDALAPSFAGEKNIAQALKLIAYSYTASWVASVAVILPFLGTLILIAGVVYGIYLIYLGLPHTMKCPPERAVGYTAVTIIIGLVLSMIIGSVVGSIAGTSALMSGAALDRVGINDSGGTLDKDSALGKLAEYGKQMEAANQRVEAAKANGDDKAVAAATTAMIGAALGGGDQVEALSTASLKPFVPETLAGLPRSDYAAEQNGAMGMQMSVARATYGSDDGRSLHLSITDIGSAKGLLGLANAASLHAERETATGYEKTYKQDGRLIHEQWDNASQHGEYSVVIGDRFTVALEGNTNIDTIKQAVNGLDLAGLEALRLEGVKR